MENQKGVLFDDIFEVVEVDPDKKKFDKVSRFYCRSYLYEMSLIIDINVDVYPVSVGEKLSLMMASTLHDDGTPSSGNYDPGLYSVQTRMDTFDYVCYGKIFKLRDTNDMKVEVFASFGGLIVKLEGDPRKLTNLEMDANVYLLVRKV
ncbi:hypothetical protein BSKO_12860 [Bryopsis sp. KO-2023]|nr:hypothetical protein BSKO_12860 [Bryopsis sp. KO-2023]